MEIIFRFVKNVKCLIINLHKKQVVSTLALIYFGRPRLGQTMKSKFSNIWCFWSRDMLNFWCFTKWFVTSFLSKFVHDFSRKIFFMLYSIYWPNFIVWFSLFSEVSGNMFIVNIFCSVCDAINFEINLSFLIELFSYKEKISIKI